MVETNVFRILPLLLSIINSIKCADALPPTQSLYCTDLNPQNNVDIEQVRKYIIIERFNAFTLHFIS